MDILSRVRDAVAWSHKLDGRFSAFYFFDEGAGSVRYFVRPGPNWAALRDWLLGIVLMGGGGGVIVDHVGDEDGIPIQLYPSQNMPTARVDLLFRRLLERANKKRKPLYEFCEPIKDDKWVPPNLPYDVERQVRNAIESGEVK